MFTLNQDQEHACDLAMNWLTDKTSKFMVIMGAAGTGKSTMIEALLARIRVKEQLLAIILGSSNGVDKWQIDMMATTNKAAGVLAEMAGCPVSTVHSYLKLVPEPDYRTGELRFIKGRNYTQICNRLLIIDEAPMISQDLFQLLDESTPQCKIILVGDPYQLVATGDTGLSIMNQIDGPKATLDKIMRHDSAIAKLGAQCRRMVKTGSFTGMAPNGVDIVYADPDTCMEMVHDTFLSQDYTLDTARILTWTNKNVIKYNNYIRQNKGITEPVVEGETLITNKPIVLYGNSTVCTDTRVQIHSLGPKTAPHDIEGRYVYINSHRYKYFLPFNQAQVQKLLRQLKKDKKMHTYWQIKEEWLDLRPIYASTVHKSQGSTFDTVFIDLTDIGKCYMADETARMLYVAVTRAAKKVVFFGKLPSRYGGIIHDFARCTA